MKLEALAAFAAAEIAIQLQISDKMIEVETGHDAELRAVLLTSIIRGLSKPYNEVRYPADWWQAVKGRWFPRFLLGRFPVRLEEHVCARYCPHMGVSDNGVHVGWLEGGRMPSGE